MRKSSIVKGMAAAAAVLTFGTACSRDPQPTGQLMLALQTDMALPKDVDQVTIQILSQGIVRFNHVYRADPSADDRILIPATLGIVAGDNPNAPVTVRIIARQNGGPLGSTATIARAFAVSTSSTIFTRWLAWTSVISSVAAVKCGPPSNGSTRSA